MCGNAERTSDDNQILYDVLTLERRHQKSIPGDIREYEEWHKSHDHMQKEKRDDDAFELWNDKEYTDNALEKSKKNNELTKGHHVYSLFKELLYEHVCRT